MLTPFREPQSFAINRRSRCGSVRGCPVLNAHFSPGSAPQVGQRTARICFGLSSFFIAKRVSENTYIEWLIRNEPGPWRNLAHGSEPFRMPSFVDGLRDLDSEQLRHEAEELRTSAQRLIKDAARLLEKSVWKEKYPATLPA